jgi:hypothetical protein
MGLNSYIFGKVGYFLWFLGFLIDFGLLIVDFAHFGGYWALFEPRF